MNAVSVKIGEVRIRLARNLFAGAALSWLFRATIAFLVVLVAHRIFSPAFDVLVVAAGLSVLALGAAVYVIVRRIPSCLDAAATADREYGLQEQLSTAFLLGTEDGPFASAVIARAEAAAIKLDARSIAAFRIPTEGKLLPFALTAAVLVFTLMPRLDVLGLYRTRADRRDETSSILKAAADLERKARKVEEKAQGLDMPEAKQVVADMQQVAQMLERAAVDKSEALARISDLARKIDEQRRKVEADGVKEAFQPKSSSGAQSDSEKAIRKAMQEGGKQAAADELMRQLKSLKDSFAKQGMDAKAMAEAARELQSIADRFKLPPNLAKKMRDLSKSLKEMSQRQDLDPKYAQEPPELDFTMEELAAMIEGIKAEDFLDFAGEQVEKNRQELIKKLKLCPYCQKGLKHPSEGGQPLPGMGPKGEPGAGYI